MKTLYIDCGMGAAGDMLTAALLELVPDREAYLKKLNDLGIPGIRYEAATVNKCGINGTHMTVYIDGEVEGEHGHHHEEHGHSHEHGHHQHHGMHDIEHIVCDHLNIPDKVKQDVMSVYGIIAAAESSVHGVPVNEIHFHEVGNMDAIADITAVCMLINDIAPDRIVASPVHVGSGQVRCAHGIMPVPAPATAVILRDIPMYGGELKGELCTPTGAAILKHFVDEFGSMPMLKTEGIGYGMGRKDFERANCVRVMLGEELVNTADSNTITELSCNIDDMTGEGVGYAMECLFAEGALEVYTTPVSMKKSRPGILLTVLCRNEDREKMVAVIFKNTTTIGIRESLFNRYTLSRTEKTVNTPLGDVRKKISAGYGVTREKYEYEDLAAIARSRGISITEVLKQVID